MDQLAPTEDTFTEPMTEELLRLRELFPSAFVGDRVDLDAVAGTLTVEAEGFDERTPAELSDEETRGMGRELFAGFRQLADSAESGALSIPDLGHPVSTQRENVKV